MEQVKCHESDGLAASSNQHKKLPVLGNSQENYFLHYEVSKQADFIICAYLSGNHVFFDTFFPYNLFVKS